MNENLENLRKQIDNIDEKIITYLSKRIEIVRKIGKIKRQQNLSEFDKKRWENILNTNLAKSKEFGLSKNFIKNLLTLIHKYSLTVQRRISKQ